MHSFASFVAEVDEELDDDTKVALVDDRIEEDNAAIYVHIDSGVSRSRYHESIL